MGDDLLSVVFLALVCIVISGIVHRLTPPGMMVPTFALIAICLWVAYDYMMMRRYKAKAACSAVRGTPLTKEDVRDADDLDKRISDLENQLGPVKASKPSSLENDPDENNPDKPQAKHENEYDIAMYSRDLSIQELYKDMACNGDTRMANRMKYMGVQPRISKDIAARLNSEKLRPYFEEELDDNEKSEWWNVENDYLDNFM